ncbi:hypothetical protein [Kitasatospora sp. NPDC056184]|uniref:hypothetical protein n=1 Tax=Kitasatospora sp. NPDC056184 TaxID=3345738 RepID=UPI0035E3724B
MYGIAGPAGADAARHGTTVTAVGTTRRHSGPDGTLRLLSADGRAVLSMNTLLIVDTAADPGPCQDPAGSIVRAFNGETCTYRRAAAAPARAWPRRSFAPSTRKPA